MPKGHLLKDMTGLRFTRLLVLGRAANDKQGNAQWDCQCDCGVQLPVRGFQLRNGQSKSCGCLTTGQLIERVTKHGRHDTPEYRSWASMLQRCTNPKNIRYARYGGRGIRVCESWFDFANFYADMGPMPGRGYTIERKDNDGNYEPNNCRWATRQEQNHNTSLTRFVEYSGAKMSVTQAVGASQARASRSAVYQRLKRGWTADDALRVGPNERTGFIDLTGHRFGRLVPLSRAENGPKRRTRWLCQCDCGKQVVAYAGNLRSGQSKSCGCTIVEMLKEPGRISRKRLRQRQPLAK